MEFELTDKQIIEATRVDMFLPNGGLDPDCGYLRGRQQVAHEAQKELVKYIDKWGVVTAYGGKGLIEHDWQSILRHFELEGE